MSNKRAEDGGIDEDGLAATWARRSCLLPSGQAARLAVAAIIGVTIVAGAHLVHEQGYGSKIGIVLLFAFAATIASKRDQLRASAATIGNLTTKLAVALLGLQFSASQLIELGSSSFIALISVMTAAFLGGLIGSRLSGAPASIGVVVGGATAICGVSAAAVIFAILGPKQIQQREFVAAVIGILIASSATVVANTIIADRLHLDDTQIAFLFGSTVHDAAQAIAGAYAFGDTVGGQATVLKMARVALLIPFAIVLGSLIGSRADHTRVHIRTFILPAYLSGFIILASLNSLALVPDTVATYGQAAAKSLLLFAITMTILGLKMTQLTTVAWKGVVSAAAGASIFSLIAATASLKLL